MRSVNPHLVGPTQRTPNARSLHYLEAHLPHPQLEQYNDALVRRGSLTLWVEQDTPRAWQHQGPVQQGAQFEYSDTAIVCLLTLRSVYHLTLRATEGFARSLFELMHLDLPVPDYSTLCRRAKTVRITLPKKAEGPLHSGPAHTNMMIR